MTIKVPKSSREYSCKTCDYHTSRLSQYDRHLLTAKHKLMTKMMTNNDMKTAKAFVCEDCGNEYKYRQGLSVHRKKCQNTPEPTNIDLHDNASPDILDRDSILTLIKQNNDFKDLLVESNQKVEKSNQKTAELLEESNQKTAELQQQLVDAVKNNTSIVTNNITNNNQKFNLNFFLNDTCKDAMSITDFLGSMNVNFNELEYIGNHGYVNGMTKMIMDRLKGMDVTKRPIHCTDIKRETMYIKEDDGWSKDTEELTKLRRILSSVSMTNYRTVPVWRNAHPDSEVMDSRTHNFCYKMMRAILGDAEDEQIRLDNKIIKTMSKDLFVSKY
uniref:C2H2-type domain-containing protein n=1 Tax=viral metagenome TaxID=1070528 RepID=A0A6C0J1S7_9ZZZZ